VTLWDTDPAEVPRLRHVECEVWQDAEDTHAEVGGRVRQHVARVRLRKLIRRAAAAAGHKTSTQRSAAAREHPDRGRRPHRGRRQPGDTQTEVGGHTEVGGGQETPRQRSAATQRSAAARLARQKFTTLLRILRCRRMTEMTRTLPSNASQLGSEHHHYHNHHHFIV